MPLVRNTPETPAVRNRGRVDSNQTALVKELRKIGLSVAITSSLGKGFPDIVVGWQGKNFLFEIKDPGKPPSARVLTEAEQDFADGWRGQITTVLTLDDCLKAIHGGI